MSDLEIYTAKFREGLCKAFLHLCFEVLHRYVTKVIIIYVGRVIMCQCVIWCILAYWIVGMELRLNLMDEDIAFHFEVYLSSVSRIFCII